MTRSFRWPLLTAALAGGLVAGRYVGLPATHGQTAPTAHAIPRELTSYRDVVKQVLPAVVSIEAKSKPKKAEGPTARRNQPQLDEQQIPEEFRRFFQLPDSGDMIPRQRQAFGSGFIVDAKGLVMTNNHVVDGADEVEITLTDGRKFTSTDIKTDKATDLAIVRIKANEPLPFLKFGDSTQTEIGDRVLAVGAPFGLAGSVTHGIISAKGRDLGLNRYDDFLQTDAAINPGNSGGPLVNLAGEVVGINSVIKSRSGGFQGVGMAITSNTAHNVMQQLEKNGTVKRPYLGIEMAREVTPEVASRLGMKDNQGVVVARVVPNSPADKAGVKSDDVITELNGHAVHDNRSLLRTVGSLPVGATTEMEVLRDGHPTKLSLKLEEQPKDYGMIQRPNRSSRLDGEGVTVEKFGLELQDLPADRADNYGVKRGALVTGVEQGSASAEAGISSGMVITKVDRKEVDSADAAKQALEKADTGKGALLHLRSVDGTTAIVLLKK
ncbi:MAG TPA: trypsin-like peptidase domain-containing protein [Gemmataceae bacterium]|jgi:serine protease Do|nr:trypsin-like peptidase domain-containing protein [Gemmataceae bacterium]